jgi:hypothetical protein
MADLQEPKTTLNALADVLLAKRDRDNRSSDLAQKLSAFPKEVERALATLLPGIKCRLDTADARPVTVTEMESCVIGTALLAGVIGSVVIMMPRQALLAMASVLLGGVDDNSSGRRERALSALDCRMAETLFSCICSALNTALVNNEAHTSEMPSVAVNPAFSEMPVSMVFIISAWKCGWMPRSHQCKYSCRSEVYNLRKSRMRLRMRHSANRYPN